MTVGAVAYNDSGDTAERNEDHFYVETDKQGDSVIQRSLFGKSEAADEISSGGDETENPETNANASNYAENGEQETEEF